jgi:hypothetical protein
MARATKQFLKAQQTSREYDTVDVEVTLSRMPRPVDDEALLVAHNGLGRQLLFLSKDEARSLAVELLKFLETDDELGRVVRLALAGNHPVS